MEGVRFDAHASVTPSIPLDGQLVDLSAAIQGADLLGTGACSTVRVSDTVVVTVQ